MKKVSKKDWLPLGLSILEKEGFQKITIDYLCTLLNVSKGSFYYHFKNIDGYIEALMKYWLEEYTFNFIKDAEQNENFDEKYKVLVNKVVSAPYRMEQVIRAWGHTNAKVRLYVEESDKLRLEYVKKLKLQNGMDEETATQTSMIELAILIGIQQLYPDISNTELIQIYTRCNLI